MVTCRDGGNADGASSANYTVQGPITGSFGDSSSTGYIVVAGFHSPPDSDADSVRNFLDNCIEVANPDADLNGDGRADFADLAILKSMFFTAPGPSGLKP